MQCQRTLTRLTLFGAALLFVLVLPQTSRAQSTDRVGVVERLQGDVSIVHFGNSAKATQGMAISLKDQLVTGADARLQIMLADDTQITLGENAKAVIKEYHFSPFSSGNRGVVLVEVSKGAFLFTTGRISQLADKRIEVKTALANLMAKGTEFWGGPTGEDTEGVAVFEGSVDVSNEGARSCSTPGPSRSPASSPRHRPQACVQDHPQIPSARRSPAVKARARRSSGSRRRRIVPWLRSRSEAR